MIVKKLGTFLFLNSALFIQLSTEASQIDAVGDMLVHTQKTAAISLAGICMIASSLYMVNKMVEPQFNQKEDDKKLKQAEWGHFMLAAGLFGAGCLAIVKSDKIVRIFEPEKSWWA